MKKKLLNILDNDVLRAAVATTPFGSGLVVAYETYQRERQREFFELLNNRQDLLTPEIIVHENFIHFFIITMNAVNRTKRAEKIKYFGNLILNYVECGMPDNDRHEELLLQFDLLKLHDIFILMEIEKFEINLRKDFDEKRDGIIKLMTGIQKHWPDFLKNCATLFGIELDDVKMTVIRLVRQGLLISDITLAKTDIANTFSTSGLLTPIYYEMKKITSE